MICSTQKQIMSTRSTNFNTDAPIDVPVVTASKSSIDTSTPKKRLVYKSVYHPPDGRPSWCPYEMTAYLE